MTLQTLNLLALIWTAIALCMIPVLLRTKQPYGRHTTTQWGPLMSNKLGWIIQEAPSMIFLTLFFVIGTGAKSAAGWVMWGLWILHYVNRTFIFPLRTRTAGKKIPMLIVLAAIGFNFVNGFLNGYYLGNFSGNYDNSFFTSPQFIVGLVLFATGFFINNQSDTILINLRKPGETGYKIPTGGLYNYISCPNYFGEIVEWTGFAIIVNAIPAWSFVAWAVANLVPRALDHHKWYIEKFPDYPKQRKAIIPFIL